MSMAMSCFATACGAGADPAHLPTTTCFSSCFCSFVNWMTCGTSCRVAGSIGCNCCGASVGRSGHCWLLLELYGLAGSNLFMQGSRMRCSGVSMADCPKQPVGRCDQLQPVGVCLDAVVADPQEHSWLGLGTGCYKRQTLVQRACDCIYDPNAHDQLCNSQVREKP